MSSLQLARKVQSSLRGAVIIQAVLFGAFLLLLSYPDLTTLAPWLPVPPGVIDLLRRLISLAGMLFVGTGLIGRLVEDRNWGRWLERWLSVDNRAPLILTSFMVLHVVMYTAFTWQRHYFFNSAGFDLGLQSQVVWNTAQGNWFATSIEAGNYLGDHFQPLLGILAIPYKIYPSVIWLLLFQSLCLALGAIPLFFLARRQLSSSLGGLVFALIYLLSPSLGYVNRFDFHFEIIVVPLLLAAWEAIDRNKLYAASIFLGVALFGKEEIGLTVAVLGFIAALQFRKMRFGLTWMTVGIGYSLVALFILIPMFRSVESVHQAFSFAGNVPSDTLARYAWLGQTPGEIVHTILFQPMFVLQGVHQRGWFFMLLTLFAPVAFTPLFRPVYLLALAPSLAYNLLADFWPQHTSYYQYTVPAVSVTFISAVYGAKWLLADSRLVQKVLNYQSFEFRKLFVLVAILAFSLMSFVYRNPFSDQGVVNNAWTRQSNEPEIRAALSLIPPHASVATTNHYAPHLSARSKFFLYYEFRNDYSTLLNADYWILNLADDRDASPEEYRQLLLSADQEDFGVIYSKESVVVLQRSAGDRVQLDQLLASYP